MSRSWPASSGAPLPKRPHAFTPARSCHNPTNLRLQADQGLSSRTHQGDCRAAGPVRTTSVCEASEAAAVNTTPDATHQGSQFHGAGTSLGNRGQEHQPLHPSKEAFTHTRTVGFGAQQCSMRTLTSGIAADGTQGPGSFPSPQSQPAPASSLAMLELAPHDRLNCDDLAW